MHLRTWYRHPAYNTCFAMDVTFTKAQVNFAAHEGGATQVPVLKADEPPPPALVAWLEARSFHEPEALLALIDETWRQWRVGAVTDADAKRTLARRLADTPTAADAYPQSA